MYCYETIICHMFLHHTHSLDLSLAVKALIHLLSSVRRMVEKHRDVDCVTE